MEVIDIKSWKRRRHFDHFMALKDPFFQLTVPVEVEGVYHRAKAAQKSLFGSYLFDCMQAINDVDALRLRIQEDQVVAYDVIHASATLMRADLTYAFSWIHFERDLDDFLKNIRSEQQRIEQTDTLYPEINGLDCIYCSAMPWVQFTGHKEPRSGTVESVPKLAFSKIYKESDRLKMNVSIAVNHALVDGYDIGLFVDRFNYYLSK